MRLRPNSISSKYLRPSSPLFAISAATSYKRISSVADCTSILATSALGTRRARRSVRVRRKYGINWPRKILPVRAKLPSTNRLFPNRRSLIMRAKSKSRYSIRLVGNPAFWRVAPSARLLSEDKRFINWVRTRCGFLMRCVPWHLRPSPHRKECHRGRLVRGIVCSTTSPCQGRPATTIVFSHHPTNRECHRGRPVTTITLSHHQVCMSHCHSIHLYLGKDSDRLIHCLIKIRMNH